MKILNVKIMLLSLLMIYSVNVALAQVTTGVITVQGDLDKYYPVTFYDGSWDKEVATELELGRSNVHRDGNVRGAMIAKIRFHVTNWGHGADFIDLDIQQYTNVNKKFIASMKDGSGHNGTRTIIVWLRGNTTYNYTANNPVNPVVYDGVTNPLPYQEIGGEAHTVKTSIDYNLNESGLSYAKAAYFNGSGVSYFAGRIGIGTTNPGTYKLAVEGTLGARKVKVTAQAWADFVFDADYKLPSLNEIETHIKAYKHLPGIPSANEVEKNGLDIGEMQQKQMQKIEELTLYLIDQNKKIETQQQLILDQQRLLSAQELRLKALENKLSK